MADEEDGCHVLAVSARSNCITFFTQWLETSRALSDYNKMSMSNFFITRIIWAQLHWNEMWENVWKVHLTTFICSFHTVGWVQNASLSLIDIKHVRSGLEGNLSWPLMLFVPYITANTPKTWLNVMKEHIHSGTKWNSLNKRLCGH